MHINSLLLSWAGCSLDDAHYIVPVEKTRWQEPGQYSVCKDYQQAQQMKYKYNILGHSLNWGVCTAHAAFKGATAHQLQWSPLNQDNFLLFQVFFAEEESMQN